MVRLQTLEAEPGDMLRDPENVKANAEATVARYHERLQAEQQARDQVISCLMRGETCLNANTDLIHAKRDLLICQKRHTDIPNETCYMPERGPVDCAVVVCYDALDVALPPARRA